MVGFIFLLFFFSFKCGVEANVYAQPPKQCLLALMRAIQSEEVVKCWEKGSKSSLKPKTSVPSALICGVMCVEPLTRRRMELAAVLWGRTTVTVNDSGHGGKLSCLLK